MNAVTGTRNVAGGPFPEGDYLRAVDAVMAQPEVKFVNAFVGLAKDLANWKRAR